MKKQKKSLKILYIYIPLEKKIWKFSKQELSKVDKHHNEENPPFFQQSVNIFRWRK